MLSKNNYLKEWHIYRESPSSCEALGPSMDHHGELMGYFRAVLTSGVLPGSYKKETSLGWDCFFLALSAQNPDSRATYSLSLVTLRK